MTKILYLSMSQEKYSTNYFPFLLDYVRTVASSDTEVVIRGNRVGRVDSYRFWESLDHVSILDSVLEAEQSGFDAVAIGNMLDPGLREARSMVNIPVVGLGETSMLTACMMGSRFGLISVNRYMGGRFDENVSRYGLRERMAGLEYMGLTPHELDACFSDEAARQRATDAFREAARATLAAGAEVIIPAGGRIVAFLIANRIREVDDAPVLDGITALITAAESAVRLHASMGTFVSRRRLYAKAPEATIRAVAAEYAESYNLPALAKLAGSNDDGK
jgi:Asp/Glu/hydantoin racemase